MKSHRTPGTGIGRKAVLGGAFAVVVGLGSAITVAANAAENEVYDQAQLLTACEEDTDLYGKADRCRFEPATYAGFTGNLQQVSGVDSNCGAGEASREVKWIQTTTESNSIEVSASVEAGLSKIFSASVSTTFGHTWERSQSKEDTFNIGIPPLSAGTIFRGAPLAKVTGRMVINFSSRRQGHFEWYAYPTLEVPAEDQPKAGGQHPAADPDRAGRLPRRAGRLEAAGRCAGRQGDRRARGHARRSGVGGLLQRRRAARGRLS
jgi:hypothetical protein